MPVHPEVEKMRRKIILSVIPHLIPIDRERAIVFHNNTAVLLQRQETPEICFMKPHAHLGSGIDEEEWRYFMGQSSLFTHHDRQFEQ